MRINNWSKRMVRVIKEFVKQHKEGIAALIAIGLLYGGMFLLGITCPIKFLTGISCAGCGMTRAWIRVLHFDLAGAFHYHPLFFLPPVFILLFLLKEKIKKSVYKGSLLTIIVVFAIVYVTRMIWFRNEIIEFTPSDNIIFRIVRWVSMYT